MTCMSAGSETTALLNSAGRALAEVGTAAGTKMPDTRPPGTLDALWQLHLDMVLAAVAYNLPADGVLMGHGDASRVAGSCGGPRPRSRGVGGLVHRPRRVAVPGDGDARVPARPGRRHRYSHGRHRRRVAPSHVDDRMVWNFSVLGLPSVVIPVGRTVVGLPVGVRVVAAHGNDHVAVAFARHAAQVLGGYTPPPPAAAGLSGAATKTP